MGDMGTMGELKKKNILQSRVVAVGVAAAALTVLAGGTGYAAAKITGADIVNGSVGSIDIRDDNLTGVDVKDGSLAAKDLSPSARQQLEGERGQRGPQGPQGQQGQQGPAGPSNVVVVDELSGDFAPASTEEAAGITLTGDGVQFGPFADDSDCATAGEDYARLNFAGLNGQDLSTLTGLSYRAQHVADGDTQGYGAIPMRIYFNDPSTTQNPDRITFSPNTQFNETANYGVAQGTVNEYLVTSGTGRVNDDAGENPEGELPMADIIEEFGDLEIAKIDFLGGCSGAATPNLRQIVTELTVNGTHYEFGAN